MTTDASHPVLVHFYRAVVSHADVWRQRMDATTNWAAATSAGMVTFAFGDSGASHVVLLLALAFEVIFLLMESRRYQIYDLWRRRFRTLNQHLIAPVLAPQGGHDAAVVEEKLASIAIDLGRTVPHLSLLEAMGFRIRRNYGYLMGAVILSWVGKLEIHPQPADGLSTIVERAAIGAIPGSMVASIVGAFIIVCAVLAARAPTDQMLNWNTVPSTVDRLLATSRRWAPGGGRGSPGGAP